MRYPIRLHCTLTPQNDSDLSMEWKLSSSKTRLLVLYRTFPHNLEPNRRQIYFVYQDDSVSLDRTLISSQKCQVLEWRPNYKKVLLSLS